MSSGRGRPRRVLSEDVRADIEREIAAHVAMRTDELIANGWRGEDARREAERLFGSRDEIVERCVALGATGERTRRRGIMLEGLRQDLGYGLRMLARSPAFTAVATLTLALGIGANTAVFSVVRSVLLEPLPYSEPHELVRVYERSIRGNPMSVAWPNFVDWEREAESFEALAAYGVSQTTVLGGPRAVTAPTASVTRDFWRVFGVVPTSGRLTGAGDHVPGGAPAFVVTEGFWRNELGGLPLGELTLEVFGFAGPVVGTVADHFTFPGGARVWGAAELAPIGDSRTAHNWRVVGRLAQGVPTERAHDEIDALTRRIVAGAADQDPEYLAAGALVRSLQEDMVAGSRESLWLLLGAAGLVLLVACTNLASTLIARGTGRLRELAVRSALGAERARLVRQLVTESALIAFLGGAVGLAVGAAALDWLVRLGTFSVPRLDEVALDAGAVAYAGALTLGTVLLFGLLPALRLARGQPGEALRSGSRGNAGDHRGAIWRLLVGTEVALALVLLVGSGLLVRSFQQLLAEDAGFDPTDVLLAPLALSQAKYGTAQEQAAWYRSLAEEMRALPGVAAAGVITATPVSGSLPDGRLEIDGDLSKTVDGVGYVVTSAGALDALDIPLLRGRAFDDGDGPESEHVAIVSQAFADRYWPGVDPIGRTVTGGGMDDFYEERPFARVVGVVGDVRYVSLDRTPIPTVYFPYSQRPFRLQYTAAFVVESATGEPAAVAESLRSTVGRHDPDVPVELVPYVDHIGDSVAQRRFTTLLLGGFSLIALLLAAVGIYGVVSYSVARRTREMGIRIALGAPRPSVLRMVMLSSLRLVSGGLVAGLVAALLGGRVLRSLLHGVSPTDPMTFVAVVAVLGGTAVLASWLPARAGTRVDPIQTMRAE